MSGISLDLENALRAFRRWSLDFPGDIPYSISLRGGQPRQQDRPDTHAVILLVQHGDEWGPLPVLLDLLPSLRAAQEQAPANRRLSIVLGNPWAALNGQRFIEFDLNRCYPDPGAARESVGAGGSGHYERDRAHEIAALVASADLVLDLHQTNQATQQPFFVFPFHAASVALARSLGSAEILLTRPIGEEDQGRCVDDFLHALDIPVAVIEVGQKGDNAMSQACTRETIAAFLRCFGGEPSPQAQTRALRLIGISRRYEFAGRADAVSAELINLSPVRRGTSLLTQQPDAVAPDDGFVVFVQKPRRDEQGCIVGKIPRIALCFAAEFNPP